jgi:hypothetical protein
VRQFQKKSWSEKNTNKKCEWNRAAIVADAHHDSPDKVSPDSSFPYRTTSLHLFLSVKYIQKIDCSTSRRTSSFDSKRFHLKKVDAQLFFILQLVLLRSCWHRTSKSHVLHSWPSQNPVFSMQNCLRHFGEEWRQVWEQVPLHHFKLLYKIPLKLMTNKYVSLHRFERQITLTVWDVYNRRPYL